MHDELLRVLRRAARAVRRACARDGAALGVVDLEVARRRPARVRRSRARLRAAARRRRDVGSDRAPQAASRADPARRSSCSAAPPSGAVLRGRLAVRPAGGARRRRRRRSASPGARSPTTSCAPSDPIAIARTPAELAEDPAWAPMADAQARRARRLAAARARAAQPPVPRSTTRPRSTTPSYDALFRELWRSRRSNPSCARPTRRRSASARVAAEGFEEVRHLQPMLSLANARDGDELPAWDARVRAPARGSAGSTTTPRYVTEPKIDGLAISLVYRDGVLERGATRGDGIDRRGRHGQPAHRAHVLPQLASRGRRRRRRSSRCAARSTCRSPPSRGSTRSAPTQGLRDVHEPAQLGRRLAAPARLRRRRRRARSRSDATRSARARASSSTRTARRSPGSASTASRVNPLTRRHDDIRVGDGRGLRGPRRAARRARLRHRRRRREGRPLAEQEPLGVGRPRSALGDRVQVPADDGRSRELLDIGINVGRTGAPEPVRRCSSRSPSAASIVKLATLHNEDDIQRKDIRIGDT